MKAVCVDGSDWRKWNNMNWWQRHWYIVSGKRPKSTGPVTDEVCVVSNVLDTPIGVCLSFVEYPNSSYPAYSFRPLLGDEQEALDAIEEEVKETELIPLEA